MRCNAAIFDFDGTLLDTLVDLADSMNAVLRDFGMPVHPVDSYRYLVGQGIFKLAEQAAVPGTQAAVLEKMVVAMGERYKDSWANKTKPYVGIPEMLAELRKRGLKIGVLSNKPDVFTQIMARHFFPADAFDIVRGATSDVPRKPDPAGALLIADAFGTRPSEFLYLGDTNTDMETGRKAGMFTIGVSWGFRPREELLGAGAQAIVDHPDEILRYAEE